MIKLKSTIKKVAGKFLSKSNYPIVVASCGRSGSKMLKRHIALSCVRCIGKILRKRTSKVITCQKWNLRPLDFNEGLVYETHDYPPDNIEMCEAKFIYIYSNPFRIIYSLLKQRQKRGKKWFSSHAKHLKAKSACADQLTKDDVLHLEDNFTAWSNVESSNVFTIHLDNLWVRSHEISDFLDIDVTLPKRKPRTSTKNDFQPGTIQDIKETYQKFNKKVQSYKG